VNNKCTVNLLVITQYTLSTLHSLISFSNSSLFPHRGSRRIFGAQWIRFFWSWLMISRSCLCCNGPRDAQSQSKYLVNCCTTVGTSCTTNPQQIEAIGSKHYGGRMCNKLCASGHDVSTVVGPSVVNKLDRRQVLLKTRSTYRGKIFQVHSLGQISRRSYPYFVGTRIFL